MLASGCRTLWKTIVDLKIQDIKKISSKELIFFMGEIILKIIRHPS